MFDKKYIAGIASFAGITVNNVKATDNGILTINIDGVDYTMGANNIAAKKYNNIKEFLEGLAGKVKEIKKDNKPFAGTINEENYFVKSVKENDSEKLEKDFSITLNANTAGKIELVSKKDKIKIEYDENCKKRLKSSSEKEILKKLVQGKELNGLSLGSIVSNDSTLKNVTINTEHNNVIGKDIDLFANNEIVNFVVKGVEDDNFKTIVFDIPEDIKKKLVEAAILDNIYEAKLDDIIASKEGAAALTKLNEIKIDNENNVSFFTGNFEILKDGDDGTKMTVGDKNSKADISGATFCVLKGIEEKNINPIYFKKNFTVELIDNSNKKTLTQAAKTTIEKALNDALSDKVVKVEEINDELIKLNSIFEDNKFGDFTNLEIDGTDKSTPLAKGHIVNKENVLIKIKLEAFKKDAITDVITLTFNTSNISKDGRKINTELANKITKFIESIKAEISKSEFVKEFNKQVGNIKSNNQELAENDFDFGTTVKNNEKNITVSGEIKLQSTVIANLDDKCFEPKKDQTDQNNNQNQDNADSKGTNVDSGNKDGDNKDAQKGCCGSNKK